LVSITDRFFELIDEIERLEKKSFIFSTRTLTPQSLSHRKLKEKLMGGLQREMIARLKYRRLFKRVYQVRTTESEKVERIVYLEDPRERRRKRSLR